MKKSKPQECGRCGCERTLTLISKVHDAIKGITYGLNRLYISCLLEVFGMLEGYHLDYTQAMKCVERGET